MAAFRADGAALPCSAEVLAAPRSRLSAARVSFWQLHAPNCVVSVAPTAVWRRKPPERRLDDPAEDGAMASTAAPIARGAFVAGAVWAGLSIGLFGAASLGVFPVVAMVRLQVDTSHAAQMALWSVVWAALGCVGVLAAGRVAFGGWLRVPLSAAAIAGIGTVLSVGVNLELQEWAVGRYGYADPDFIGLTAGLFAVLVGLAVAAFGVFVAPRGFAAWPLTFQLFGTALTALVLLSNVPGLADGIGPDSWPLAIWLGISGLYAAGAALASIIRARHPGAAPKG